MRIKTKHRRLSALLGLLALAGVAQATTVNINANVNAPEDPVYSLTSFVANGFSMGGILFVTVHFSDGSSSGSTVWVGTNSGTGAGHATGTAGTGTWTLSETGDTGLVGNPNNPDGTAVNPWTLTNTSTTLAITSVVLTGGSALVFDRDNSTGGQEGTPGSALGIDYTKSSEANFVNTGTVAVTYSSIATIAGPAGGASCNGAFYAGKNDGVGNGCGDEWGVLTFAFSGNQFITTGSSVATWAFFQDTDLVGAPEPLSLGLMGVGLLGIGFFARKRRSKSVNV